MNVELLPNETILYLFEYLSLSDLINCFSGLNLRFNRLLYQEFGKFHLDLRLLSKVNFNQVCQNYVPSIINRIISIQLSNDYDTPQQIQLFLSHNNYQLRQFIHLQSITLLHLQSKQRLNEIMVECSYLPCLAYLTLIKSTIEMSKSDEEHLFNQIWSLSKLTYCHLNISSASRSYLSYLTIVSRSLKYLIIENNIFSLSALNHLYRHTPNLQHLSATFMDYSKELQLSTPVLSITRLNISFDSQKDMLECVLKNLPNLYHLTCTMNIYINGHQWEEIIRKYLPKLKIFQMKMRFPPCNNENKEKQLNEIIYLFRTKFWINEHQWFIRCHWYTIDERDLFTFIDVFTVPYTFDTFEQDHICILAKSTYPYDQYLECDSVTKLHYGSSAFTDSIRSHIRFSNIRTLSLSFPFNEQFLSVVSMLDKLTFLFVYTDANKDLHVIQSQLQLLLDQAPRLYSIEFSSWSRFDSNAPLTGFRSVSVRRLNLIRFKFNNEDYCFDEEKCIQLSRSTLGIQCETLIVTVKNKHNVLDLMNNMSNLRSLNVHCLDHCWTETGSTSSMMNELVEWLHQQLPSTCSITREENHSFGIQIWIR